MILAEIHDHADHAEHGSTLFDEVTGILFDPGHMIAEVASHLVIEFVLLGLAVPLIKKLVRRHDEIHHSHECSS